MKIKEDEEAVIYREISCKNCESLQYYDGYFCGLEMVQGIKNKEYLRINDISNSRWEMFLKREIYKTCLDRATKWLDGVDYKLKNFNKLSQDDQRLIISAMSSTALNLYSSERYLENEKNEEMINMINRNLDEAERLMYLINVLFGSESYQK